MCAANSESFISLSCFHNSVIQCLQRKVLTANIALFQPPLASLQHTAETASHGVYQDSESEEAEHPLWSGTLGTSEETWGESAVKAVPLPCWIFLPAMLSHTGPAELAKTWAEVEVLRQKMSLLSCQPWKFSLGRGKELNSAMSFLPPQFPAAADLQLHADSFADTAEKSGTHLAVPWPHWLPLASKGEN